MHFLRPMVIGDNFVLVGFKETEWKYADYYRTGASKKLQENNVVPIKDCGSSYDESWLDEICTENRDDEE